jgi:hypothetical protein
MQYKTITLGLIEEYPILYERLRASRTMLTALDRYAQTLKTRHQAWMTELRQVRPGSAESQLSSEALELALEELKQDFASESLPSAEHPEQP